MALLKASDVVFYQPFDGARTEYTQGLNWQPNTDAYSASPAILGQYSMGCWSAWTPAHNYWNVPPYENCGSDTSWTYAVWTSGSASCSPSGCAGWWNGTYIETNHIGVHRISETQFVPFVKVNGSRKVGNAVTPAVTPARRFFAVVRAEFNGSQVALSLSTDGADWQSAGSVACGYPNSTNNMIVVSLTANGEAGARLDEAVLWNNLAPFTAEELSNLRDLLTVHNAPMSDYTVYYNNTPSGTMPLFVRGTDSASGQTPSFEYGHAIASGNTPLVISGPNVTSGSIDLFLLVASGASGQMDLFVSGPEPTSGIIDLVLWNQVASAEAPLYLHNQQAAGSVDLYLFGVLAGARPMFLRASEQTVSGTVPLSVYGSSGTSVEVKTGTVNLYLANDSLPASTGLNRPMFLKASPGGTPSATTARPLFLKGGGVAHAIADLYLEAPPAPVFSQVGLFIRGAGDEAVSNGYTPASGQRSMFIRVRAGAIVQLPLSITGFVWPSDTCDLYISGIQGIGSGTCPMALAGYKGVHEVLALTVQGFLGTASGEMPLVLEVTSTGTLERATPLYVHGY